MFRLNLAAAYACIVAQNGMESSAVRLQVWEAFALGEV